MKQIRLSHIWIKQRREAAAFEAAFVKAEAAG